ncbi:MAG: S-layer homology domain-containing protein [Clostridia bacterium]|nr:S-layer homology domain-containing protein [Clostridia bacterium]
MKKIISILMSICLIFAVLTPSVFAYENTTVKVSNILLDDGTYSVTVKGSCEPDSYVSIYVYNNSVLGAIEQCVSDALGFYRKTFPVKNIDTYNIVVNNYTPNKPATDIFKLYSQQEIEDAVADFNSASTTDDIKEYITLYGEIFGFDTTYYNASSEEYVATQMLAVKDELTRFNIVEKFDEANIRAYIYGLKTNTEDILKYYNYILEIVTSEVGMYAEYEAVDEVTKARIDAIAFETPVEDMQELCEIFFMAITEEKIKSNTSTKVDEFLETYSQYLGLDNYTDTTILKRGSIISDLKTSEIPDNTNDFAFLYESLKTSKENIVIEKPSTGAGSGGGGGGGGSSLPTEPTGYENPEMLETPAPDIVADISFDDLDGYSWATDAISHLASKGVVNGKEENKFYPADNITREEYAKIIVLAFGLYNEDAICDFVDVDAQSWSYKYIASMYGYGAINGYNDGSFGATKPITREEMAVMLYRVMQKQSRLEFASELKTNLYDYNEISDYAKNSVVSLNYNKIIAGDEKGYFNPKNNATRAEVCKMIYNSLNREGGK